MADVKISELPAAGALTGTELVPIVQSGTTKRTTAQDIADLGGGGGGTVQSVNGVAPDGSGNIALTQDDVPDGTVYKQFSANQESKLGIAVVSDPTGITGADVILNQVSLTQAEFNAIIAPNAQTMYVIVG